jgi:metal-dependent amidase/aminoacylase/carboxypeptidase family protein
LPTNLYFHFYGKPSHAGSSPHKGVNALDALVLLYNGISVLRQQLPDGIRVHGIITNGGQAQRDPGIRLRPLLHPRPYP